MNRNWYRARLQLRLRSRHTCLTGQEACKKPHQPQAAVQIHAVASALHTSTASSNYAEGLPRRTRAVWGAVRCCVAAAALHVLSQKPKAGLHPVMSSPNKPTPGGSSSLAPAGGRSIAGQWRLQKGTDSLHSWTVSKCCDLGEGRADPHLGLHKCARSVHISSV